MINAIKHFFTILRLNLSSFGLVNRIFNEAQFYEGPLKTIDKGFKPFKWFQSMYGDTTAEIMKLRVGFRDIVILKFDMNKLYDFCLNGDIILRKLIGQYFYNFGLSSGICALSGYKFLWLNVKTVFIDSKLYDELNEKNRKFFILHEIGHIVLGHHDEYSKPVFNESGNPVPVQVVNYDFEHAADTYARGYVKPCDPDNVIKAISKNDFINRSVKDLLISQFGSEEHYMNFKRCSDITLEYDIKHRFADEKIDLKELTSFVLHKMNEV